MRSHSATVWIARCSTSRMVTPRSRIEAERLEDGVDGERRQPERGLVEEEQLRLGHEGAGDGELLLLAPAQQARCAPAEVAQHGKELVRLA